MRSLRTLLSGIIDYAGLFPPASLEVSSAVRNYAQYRSSKESWALGRFILPASRLDEFSVTAESFLSPDDKPWQLSCLCSNETDFTAVHAFNQKRVNAVVDMVEGKAVTVNDIETLAGRRNDLKLFVEIPIQEDPTELILALKRTGLNAKVRTGGVTADAFPSSAHLARFVARCVEYDVEFKATAGLHHPLRSMYRLTYEPESASGKMFGFLNVFLATALARKGASEIVLAKLLEEEDHRAFAFDDNGISWGSYRFENHELKTLRLDGAASFGSCSFTEPLDDLNALGLL